MDLTKTSDKLNLSGDVAKRANLYVEEKQLPCLFESILAGLLYNRPSDPIAFMKNCISLGKDLGNAPIKLTQFMQWDASDQYAAPSEGDHTIGQWVSVETLIPKEKSSSYIVFNR